MTDIVNEYFFPFKSQGKRVIPKMKCEDGFTMSVQASNTHYCTPRIESGPWTAFEIGYPSQKEDLIMKYAETPEEPTNTVYGHVPLNVVIKVIKKHGGLKGE